MSVDPYCYEGSDVLINKLDIRDGEELERAEVDFSCNAIHELTLSPLAGKYDFQHFCKMHAYIFKDIYEWAGKPRSIPMEKAEAVLGYMSIEYAEPEKISEECQKILEKMTNRCWQDMNIEDKAINLSNDMADLWKVHAFREGNTRTVITFICQFADSQGMFMNRSLFEKHSAYTRTALVAASAVYKEGDFRKRDYLYKIIEDSLGVMNE